MICRAVVLFSLSLAMLLSGCGSEPKAAGSGTRIDGVITEGDGVSRFRGLIRGSSQCPSRDGGETVSAGIQLRRPVLIQGLEAHMVLNLHMDQDSLLVLPDGREATWRELLAEHPEVQTTALLPLNERVEALFVFRRGVWYAKTVRSLASDETAKEEPVSIEGVFSTNWLSQGEVEAEVDGGNFDGSSWTWDIATSVRYGLGNVSFVLPMRLTGSSRWAVSPNGTKDTGIDGPSLPPGRLKVCFKHRADGMEIREVSSLAAH